VAVPLRAVVCTIGSRYCINKPELATWTCNLSPLESQKGNSGKEKSVLAAALGQESMNWQRRLGLWIGSCLLILVVCCGVVIFLFFHRFYPSVPSPNFPPARDLATAQWQDFEYFRRYLEVDQAYSPAARRQAKELLTEYQTKAGSLTPVQFDLAVSRIVALADNGHSAVYKGSLSRRNNRLPCRLYHFSDGYYIIRARSASRQMLGGRVTAVDGIPVDAVVDRMFEYSGGPRNHYDQFISVFFLESPALLHAAGLASLADRLRLHIVLPDGSGQDETIIADPPDANAPHVYSDSYLSPQRIDGEGEDWTTLLTPNTKLPVFLQDYANPFQSVYWANDRVYYVEFRSNEDESGHSIGKFEARVKREIVADRPRSVVVDLRLDQGGNFVTTAGLMTNLGNLTESIEHVYVLTSAWTFSAGNVGVALLKQHGGRKVTVIGETVGDRIRLWAEGGDMTLPNSKLDIGFATGLHDYTHPCWRECGCFWTLFFFPMHLATLAPDIEVPYTFGDYAALRDPLLDRALTLATQERFGSRFSGVNSPTFVSSLPTRHLNRSRAARFAAGTATTTNSAIILGMRVLWSS
jgi:hypothetical protein